MPLNSKPKPKVHRGNSAVGKVIPPKAKTKTPVYTQEELNKLQLRKNKPKTKTSMGYSGAAKI
jgi:hypothetical protein